jgi:hypothetical protein
MALSKLFNFFDLSFIHYQQGDPGFVNPYAYAYGYIGNMKYTAVAQGVLGNNISISHQASSVVPGTQASGTISGMLYTAKAYSASGNNISVTLTQGSAGSAGSATLTRALSVSGTASFSVTEKSGYYGIPTTVKFTSTGIQLPDSQLPAASASDQYFGYTSLLLRAGQGGISYIDQNVTFVDSSSNESLLVLSRFGNVQQGSSSPHARPPGYWSVYFDGAGDSSTLPDSNVFTFDANFTVEAWIRPAVTAASSIVAHWGGLATQCSFVLQLTVTGALRFAYGIAAANVAAESAAGVIIPNRWTHVAVTRVGSTLRLFANGQVVSTTSAVGSFNNNPNPLTIGRQSTDFFTGHISNLHLVKGTALYAANFTPSTSPAVAVSGTVLLTCQDNRFVDRSAVGSVLTTAGDTVVSTTSPFAVSEYSPSVNGASAYFDGVGDYLAGTAGAGYNFGTGDFTVEAWAWWDGTYPSAQTSRIVYATGSTTSPDQMAISTSGITFGGVVASGVNPKINSWNHIAGTRSGTAVRIFLNGALVGSGTNASSIGSSVATPLVGIRNDSGSNYGNWKGYLSDLRVVKGTAVYTAAFSVPTAPLSAVSGTSLLLNCANASIVDMTNTVDIETVGNAASSSAVTKFASKSMFFDGSGDYLSVGTIGQAPLSLGTGDFTIEAWIYPAATITGGPAIYANYGGSRTGAYLLRLVGASGGKLALNVYPTGDLVTSTSNIAVGAWTNVVAVRSGGTLRLYVNGVLEASVANSTNLVSDTAHAATVGGYWQAAALEANGYFNGYIEDLRVTKATGRYSAPTSVSRGLNGTTEVIRFPTGTTVAQVLAVVGNSGTDPSSRVAIASSSSGILSATDPSPNDGATTSGGVLTDSLLASITGTDIAVRIAGGGSTNVAVKSALEANASIADLITATSPVGSATATAATFLTGGSNETPAAISVAVTGNSAVVSAPAGTTSAELVSALSADVALSALVTPEATGIGSISIPGSVVLAGGVG